MKTPKWTDVYPSGTAEGNEEFRFFKSLARDVKYEWKSTAALAKEANLTKKRTEEIILKYYKLQMIFQNPKNEDFWGYWERVPHMIPKPKESISQNDKDKRVKNKH